MFSWAQNDDDSENNHNNDKDEYDIHTYEEHDDDNDGNSSNGSNNDSIDDDDKDDDDYWSKVDCRKATRNAFLFEANRLFFSEQRFFPLFHKNSPFHNLSGSKRDFKQTHRWLSNFYVLDQI